MTLLSLEAHHIVDLYCWVDDSLSIPSREAGGRPLILRDSELITMLLWNTVVLHQKTLKDLHTFARIYLSSEFPKLPTYTGFVAHCHRVTPVMFLLLQNLLCTDEPIKIADSTMLEVCKLQRADQHKVAKNIAAFGRNHQGWHYGFKLHTSITLTRKLCAVALTPANIYDAQVMPSILQHTKIAVGDSHYGARVMRERLWKTEGVIVIAPPHHTQKTKITTPWQQQLLNMRSKIEAVFDILKEHLHLVSSFPRSVFGYLVHYIRILLGYQIIALSCAK
jgi:hypothetical protein